MTIITFFLSYHYFVNLEVTNQIDEDNTSVIKEILYFIFNDLSASFCFQPRYLKKTKFITNRSGH